MQVTLHEGYLCDIYKLMVLNITCKFNLGQILDTAKALITSLPWAHWFYSRDLSLLCKM